MPEPVLRLADPAAEYQALRPAIDQAVQAVLASGAYILGPAVERFEREAAAYLGVRHAIGLSNGTDAIVAALQALGVGPGHEVIVPAFSFIATAGAVVRAGARPVFADVDATTFLVRTDAVAAATRSATRAFVPVHLFGRVSSVEASVPVVEDVAQAFGAGPAGRRAGTVGDAGTFSFFPAKPLGAAGDAGMLVTQDDAVATRVRRLRVHGAVGKNRHADVGGNYRMDPLQAAVLSVKLGALDGWIETRRRNADRYRTLLADVRELVLPADDAAGRHIYAQFVVRADDRDALAKRLADDNVETAVYYPIPLPLQPVFEHLGHRAGEFPGAEAAARTVLALPVHGVLSDADVARVVSVVRRHYGYGPV